MATVDPHEEILNGDEAKAIKWVENAMTTNVDLADTHSFTVLHWAVRKGMRNLVNALIAKNADINAKNEQNDTPLHYAVSEGHADLVKQLIALRADVNVPNKHGNTPLHYACFWRHNDIAKLLVEAGALVSIENRYGEVPLARAGKLLSSMLKDLAVLQNQSLDVIPFKETITTTSTSKFVSNALGNKVEFDYNHFENLGSIGSGHMGECFKVKWVGKHMLVLKSFHNQAFTAQQHKTFINEATAMKSLIHKNLIPLLGVVPSTPHIGLVSEFVQAGSLHKVLHDPSITLEETHRVGFALCIARAMAFLHETGKPSLPYFDLNSHSCLVDEDLTVRVNVADSDMTFNAEHKVQIFRPHWMAPEILKGETVDKMKADVFSFAMIMFELFSRSDIFAGMNAMQIGMKVALEQLRPTIPQTVPKHFTQLINLCWAEDATQRPAFDRVIPILEKCL